jgi:hypothetical protein
MAFHQQFLWLVASAPALLLCSCSNDSIQADATRLAQDVVNQVADNSSTSPGGAGRCQNGLVAWYPFNGNADDASGHGHNGTVYGAQLTTDRFGKVNSAYQFNGANCYIEVPNPADGSLDFGLGDFSLTAWIKTTAVACPDDPDRDEIAAKGDPYNEGYGVSLKCSRACAFIGDTHRTGWSDTTGLIVDDGQWHLVGVEREAGIVKIIANGYVYFTYPYSGSVTTATDFFIGKHPIKDLCYFDGAIGDVRLYNRALSDTELLALVNSGR